jgi:hypothetical protein
MKLIILILANDNTLYLQCQSLWKKYMHNHPNIKSYFIKFNNKLDKNVLLKDDTIFIKGYESYIPGCLLKTFESIKYLLSVEDFDYVFRTNMSSVVDLNKLYNLLHNYNKDYSGVIGIAIHNNNIKFASGAGMLLSKYFCEFLINNSHLLNYTLLDDVSIGLFSQNNNIQLYPLTRFEAFNYTQNVELITKELISEYYHFRCKDENNPINTIALMEKVINIIY